MAKNPQTPLSRTARLLDLVPYLTTHQGIELETLCKEFDVTQAQIVADLTTLWMCGLPGYTALELMDLSFDSGFVTIHNAETLSRPRSLNDEESIALLLGLDLIIQSLPDDRQDLKIQALDLIQKLSARSSLGSQLRAVPSTPGSIRATIQKAVTAKSSLTLVYHSSYSDTVSERSVLPLELYVLDGSEYLRAICHNVHALRNFRLDRIQSAVSADNVESTNQSFDGGSDAKTSYSVRTHARPRAVMERFSIQKSDFDQVIETSSFSTEWIRRSVLSCSGDAELLSPVKIRAEITKVAQVLLNRYKAE